LADPPSFGSASDLPKAPLVIQVILRDYSLHSFILFLQ